MKDRVISGVVIFIAAVGFGLLGGLPLAAVLGVCSVIGYYEMTRALGVHDPGTRFNLLEAIGMGGTALYWILLVVTAYGDGAVTDDTLAGPLLSERIAGFVTDMNSITLVMILGVFFAIMAAYVLTFPRFKSDQVVGAIFAFVYIPVMIACIFRSRYLPLGKFVYALIFFCSWICDTGAWLFGRLFGRHKAFPVLSPKKTIEGCIGGVFCGTLLCFLAAVILGMMDPGTHVEMEFIIIGVCGCLISMAGDLAASAIKRNHGIKDYGKVIPGHGGIMDRFDSIIFTAPIIYYLAVLLLVVLKAEI